MSTTFCRTWRDGHPTTAGNVIDVVAARADVFRTRAAAEARAAALQKAQGP